MSLLCSCGIAKRPSNICAVLKLMYHIVFQMSQIVPECPRHVPAMSQPCSYRVTAVSQGCVRSDPAVISLSLTCHSTSSASRPVSGPPRQPAVSVRSSAPPSVSPALP